MTITIDRPQPVGALPSGHPLRRVPARMDSAGKVGSGSTRYLTRERQDGAAAYYDERLQAKFIRAYVRMSPFLLKELIRRLEASLAPERGNSRHDWFRLEAAKEAQITQIVGGFRLPALGDIPKDSPVKLRQRFLEWGIQSLRDQLQRNVSKDSTPHDVLRERLKAFEAELKGLGITVKTVPTKQPRGKQARKKTV